MRNRYHSHIGPLMRESLFFQLICHHLESIEITRARQGWPSTTLHMKRYWSMQLEVDLPRLAAIGTRKKSVLQSLGAT